MKLLIADDEKLIRQGIRFIVEESGLAFKDIFEAGNGREAVRLSRQHSPEIILMDIKMPGLDGINAAKLICGFNANCKIIFLTAYDHFEYAREAVRCKARDFLVKPVSRNELVKAIQACWDETNCDLMEVQREDQIKQELFRSIENFLIGSLVPGTSMPPQKVWNKLRIISPAAGEPWFTREYPPNVCIVLKHGCRLPVENLKKTRNITVGKTFFPLLMDWDNDRVICLTRVREESDEAKKISAGVAAALAEVLFGPDGGFIRAGIGNVCGDTQSLSQSYSEACRAVDHGIAAEGESSGVTVFHIGDMDENRKFSRPYQVVQQAINYMENNYSKKISLGEVARKVYLNPVYLSTIIKQQTGNTFSDHLTLIKMEKAKRMLASSLPVKEVALAVGYQDSNYFCRVFKKVTGVTATYYRKKEADRNGVDLRTTP